MLIGMLLPASSLRADKPAKPEPWFATSEGGHFFFTMTPVLPKDGTAGGTVAASATPKALGMAYAVEERSGDLKPLWRMEEAYAPEGFLSKDGKSLVCFGPWATDMQHHSDVALTFYHEGKRVKQYQVRDLLQDATQARNSVSYYEWRSQVQADPAGFSEDGTFPLVTIDQRAYCFDAVTGNIVSSGTDSGTKSGEAAEQAPKPRLSAPPWSKEWDAAFEISMHGLEAKEINKLKTQGWSAVLHLRQKLAVPCEILAWFPLSESGQIDTKLTPQEIVKALEKTLIHPSVARRVQAGRTNGLRLFIEGNELRNNHDALVQCLDNVRPTPGARDKPEDLHPWARFSLLGPPSLRNWPDIMVNTRTHEIIVMVPYIDFGTFWFLSYMLDAEGAPSTFKTEQQILDEAAKNKGLELLQASSFKADYEARFTLSKVGTEEHGEHKAWYATLTLQQPLPVECVAYVDFSVSKDDKIEGQVPAAEMEAAMQMAVRHPAILKTLEDEREELAEYKARKAGREGDALDAWDAYDDRREEYSAAPLTLMVGNHWRYRDRTDLRHWLQQRTPETDPEPEMRLWVCFEIPRLNRFEAPIAMYLNMKTGEVMRVSTDTNLPTLWDAKGMQIKTDHKMDQRPVTNPLRPFDP